MTTEKVDFTDIPWGGVQWTMLCTLYLRAYESRNQQSILADQAAAEAVDRMEYDFDRLHRSVRPNSNQYTVALRAWRFDAWAADFVKRHPDAVVLHLGCGLDSRAFRLDLPAGVTWFDVDVPQVIELRRRLYDETGTYRMIDSSVTETEWLEQVPNDRPTLIVAEGLLMYLQPQEVRDLLERLTDRFKTGELLFDVLPPWIVRVSKIQHWGIKDVREIERWNPRLRYVETATPMTGNVYERVPSKGYRRLFRVFATFPFLRNFIRQLRFTF
jgi:methyltransferase (TIGR00027 family)